MSPARPYGVGVIAVIEVIRSNIYDSTKTQFIS